MKRMVSDIQSMKLSIKFKDGHESPTVIENIENNTSDPLRGKVEATLVTAYLKAMDLAEQSDS